MYDENGRWALSVGIIPSVVRDERYSLRIKLVPKVFHTWSSCQNFAQFRIHMNNNINIRDENIYKSYAYRLDET